MRRDGYRGMASRGVGPLSRRAALLLPLAAAGCTWFNDLFGEHKVALPGKRLPVLAAQRALKVDNPPDRPVSLPRPEPLANLLQAGGTPSHVGGHVAVRDTLAQAWSTSIGEGGGYRAKITARPVIDAGRVYAMDSTAVVSAFDVKGGSKLWSFDCSGGDDSSSNVGGGLAIGGGTLYASTGLATVFALDPNTGKQRWKGSLPTAARAAPTIADGLLYVPTLDDQLIALSAKDGSKAWSYQAQAPDTPVLGLPSPAYADGLVVAGFGAGDLICLRATSGAVTWTDNLSSIRGRVSMVDLAAIHGMPVIDESRVIATGLGGLLVSIDLRSGRRLWERDIASDQTPWVAGDWIFVLSTEQELACFNRQDGAVAWVTQLPQWQDEKLLQGPIRWIGPALAGDRLIVAGSSDDAQSALAVSPYTGRIIGQQDLSAPPSVPPVVAEGTVFIVTNDGDLLALR